MLFYIYGTDAYLCQEKLEEIKLGFVEKKDKGGINVVHLSADGLLPDSLIQEVLTVPFLSEKKLIIVSGLCADNRAGQKKIREEILDFLKERENRLENNLLFIDVFEEKKKIPEKDHLFNFLSKQKYSWQLSALRNNQLGEWLKKYCTKNQILISAPAITELITLVGNDLLQLENELKKLKAYKNGEIIAPEDVKNLVKAKYDNDIFRLTDALAAKNKKLSLKLLSDQLNSGNEPLSLLGSINWQFKTLLKIKSLLENNPRATAASISTAIGLHPFVAGKNLPVAKKLSFAELVNIQNQLLQIEIQLKSGHKNPELLFDIFIAKNC